ncbi:MAG: FadR/GntR family transcriptional regulator [Butyricicoccus sp.]
MIDCLTTAMRNKELKPGDKLLPEPEMASQMGVARSSVREAIKILTYLGVLESRRSEGTFVCNGFKESMIDPMVYGIILNQDDSYEDLMELRHMTEVGIMRLAVLKHDEQDISELEKLLEEMRVILARGSSLDVADAFFQVDNKFHDLICTMGRNPITEKINRVVRTLTYSMRYESVVQVVTSGNNQDLYEAHKKLCDVLRNHDLTDLDRVVSNTYFSESLQEGN